MIGEGDFGNEVINVADQQREPQSLLNWMEHLLRVRKECPEFGWGTAAVLKTQQAGVLAHRCEWKDGAVIAVHNLAKAKATVQVELSPGERLFELLGDRRHKGVDDPGSVELDGYGYRWFRVGGKQWMQP